MALPFQFPQASLLLTRDDVLDPSPTPHPSLRSAVEEYTRLVPYQRSVLRVRHSHDTDRTVFYDLKVIDSDGTVRRHTNGVIVTVDGTSLFVETVRDSVNGEWQTTTENLSAL